MFGRTWKEKEFAVQTGHFFQKTMRIIENGWELMNKRFWICSKKRRGLFKKQQWKRIKQMLFEQRKNSIYSKKTCPDCKRMKCVDGCSCECHPPSLGWYGS